MRYGPRSCKEELPYPDLSGLLVKGYSKAYTIRAGIGVAVRAGLRGWHFGGICFRCDGVVIADRSLQTSGSVDGTQSGTLT